MAKPWTKEEFEIITKSKKEGLRNVDILKLIPERTLISLEYKLSVLGLSKRNKTIEKVQKEKDKIGDLERKIEDQLSILNGDLKHDEWSKHNLLYRGLIIQHSILTKEKIH